MLQQRPKRLRSIRPTNLLTRRFAPRHIANRYLQNLVPKPNRLRSSLRAKLEPVASQMHRLQDIAPKRLVASCLVRYLLKEQKSTSLFGKAIPAGIPFLKRVP
jgi:hypothetical protein